MTEQEFNAYKADVARYDTHINPDTGRPQNTQNLALLDNLKASLLAQKPGQTYYYPVAPYGSSWAAKNQEIQKKLGALSSNPGKRDITMSSVDVVRGNQSLEEYTNYINGTPDFNPNLGPQINYGNGPQGLTSAQSAALASGKSINEVANMISPSGAATQPTPSVQGVQSGQTSSNTPMTPPSVNLQQGSTDSASVKQLQSYLVANGFMTQADMNTGPGIYGPRTTAAVAKMQQALKLPTGAYNGNQVVQVLGASSGGTPTAPNGTVQWDPVTQSWVPIPTTTPIDPMTPSNGSNPANPPTPGLPPGIGNQVIPYGLPEEAWKTLVPQLTPGTTEYDAAMEKIDNAFYDILQQQMTAQTEQQHQVADYNWSKLREYINTNLNTTLSNDAMQAWDQLQGIKNQFGALNLENSGLQAESMDQYLRKMRANDASQRYTAQTKQDEGKQAYYSQYATPAEVQSLINSNPTLAKQLGLVPSDEIKAAMTPAALKAKYPNMTDEQIAKNIAVMLDENGNYRSALYQKYMTGSSQGVNSGSVDPSQTIYGAPGAVDGNGNPLATHYGVTPGDTGVLDIKAASTYNKQLGAEAAGQMALYNARKAAGLIPSNKSTNANQNTQFDSATGSGTNSNGTVTVPTNASTPSSTVPATTTNPMPGITTNTTGQNSSAPKPATPAKDVYEFTAQPNGYVSAFNKTKNETMTGPAAQFKQYGYVPK